MATCISFLRVPDIFKTVKWYESIGFKCIGTHQEPGCELDWALLDWLGARFMLYPEGNEDYKAIKDAGLYFTVNSIDDVIKIIDEKAELIEINPRTEYGMKEIVLKDVNGFQITFACDPGS
jgi:hypothetical protein